MSGPDFFFFFFVIGTEVRGRVGEGDYYCFIKRSSDFYLIFVLLYMSFSFFFYYHFDTVSLSPFLGGKFPRLGIKRRVMRLCRKF